MAGHKSPKGTPEVELMLDRREFMQIGAAGSVAAAAALAAVPSWAQTGPAQTGSIDLHSHWIPKAYSSALLKILPDAFINPNPMNYDLDLRRQWMDQRGVQMVALTLDGGMPWPRLSPADGARLAAIVNDAGAEAHARFPNRFVAGIEIPVMDPAMAVREIRRAAPNPGMRAVHLPNSFSGRDYLFEPEYQPLLATSEEMGLPLLFHPLDGDENIYGGKERLGNALAQSANINNTLGFTFDTATTATKFIITGTLDRFPKLEIVLPHSGGCFPYIAGRVERGLVAKNFKLQRPFRDYIRRFHYDSMTFYPETLRFLISLVGSDRIVIGTDSYAAMNVEQPNAMVEQLNLSAPDRDRILRGNAARLCRL